MREIVLDTETTGLSAKGGHRITEIGCVEIINKIPSNNFFQTYVNPERDVPYVATKITGLTEAFLKNHPKFSEIVDSFLEFIGDSRLVIHNAAFDLGFINHELSRLGMDPMSSSNVTDTLLMARSKFPGSPASLDALCKRFKIDLSVREKHGALLDSKLLAEVYLELCGGRQRTIDELNRRSHQKQAIEKKKIAFPTRSFVDSDLSEDEADDFISKFIKNPLWTKI